MTGPPIVGVGETARRIHALQAIIEFADQSQSEWARKTAVDWILGLTSRRSVETAKAISNLIVDGGTAPALMLCRPLFEDMIVAHWLLMQDDPTFLVQRFFDHADAALIQDYDHFTTEMGVPHGDAQTRPGVAEALARRDQLSDVGTRKDPFWWGARKDGERVIGRLGMPSIVKALGKEPRYASRFQGEGEQMLKNSFALSTRWANEHLHHSPRGLPGLLRRDGGIWWPDRTTGTMGAVFTAYWTLGQTIYLQLTYGIADATLTQAQAFHELFVARMLDVLHSDDIREAMAEAQSESATLDPTGFAGATREQGAESA